MKRSEFDELGFFAAIDASGVRALLIGRRALVVLGLPVLTADYDFWVHSEDVDRFNTAAAPFDLVPTHSPQEARLRGRYVLENDERGDVLIAPCGADHRWPDRGLRCGLVSTTNGGHLARAGSDLTLD
jgi:hypothetical protein